jgi:hypothetical protein
MRSPWIRSPDGPGIDPTSGVQTDDMEVAVMKGPMDWARAGSIARRMAALCLGIPLAGCASMTQDVDAYYRQMAVNYQEAVEQAKLDETKMEHQAQVMATTGDKKMLQKAERILAKIRKSEVDYAHQQKRFEKAADWMESHFDINKEAIVRLVGTSKGPEAPPTADPIVSPDHDVKQTLHSLTAD